MPQYDDIKEMKIKLNVILTSNGFERNDKIRINEKIKKVAHNIFQKESLKNIIESHNINCKKKKLGINNIRNNLFRLILFINLFFPIISSSFDIKIKTKSVTNFKICKCGSTPPNTISGDRGEIIIDQYINGYNSYIGPDNYIIIESTPAQVHNIKLSWYDKPSSLKGFFQGCDEIEAIDFTNFFMHDIFDMSHFFDSCTSLKNINYFDPYDAVDMSYLFYNCISLTTINYKHPEVHVDRVVNMNHMFYNCSSLNTISLVYYDTQKVENMNSLFAYCSSLTEIIFGSNFKTSKVTDMNYMFAECRNLRSLNILGFETSEVKYMNSMFKNCIKLREIDVSNFDTSKVLDMEKMFNNCQEVEILDVSSFYVQNVKKMKSMFEFCSKLTSLIIYNFATKDATDMSFMFYGCSDLKYLDVSSFKIINVLDMSFMFYGCKSLTSIVFNFYCII